jgi:hypothetical protein
VHQKAVEVLHFVVQRLPQEYVSRRVHTEHAWMQIVFKPEPQPLYNIVRVGSSKMWYTVYCLVDARGRASVNAAPDNLPGLILDRRPELSVTGNPSAFVLCNLLANNSITAVRISLLFLILNEVNAIRILTWPILVAASI